MQANTAPANNFVGQCNHTVTSPEKFRCQKISWLGLFIFIYFIFLMNQLYL